MAFKVEVEAEVIIAGVQPLHIAYGIVQHVASSPS
jgi:hypothetical protein